MKSKKLLIFSWGVFVLSVLSLLTACGKPARSTASPGSDSQAQNTPNLQDNIPQVFVMKASNDFAKPELSAASLEGIQSKALLIRTITNGQEMVFKDLIHMPDHRRSEKPLFFVWSEEGMSQKIIDAHYLIREFDSQNVERGKMDRKPVNFDPDLRRWFIAFDDLFRGKEFDVDASQLQRVRIDLQLSDGSRKEWELQFRVQGLVPLISAIEKTSELRMETQPSLRGNPLEMGRAWSGLQVGVLRQQIVNPTSRTLRLFMQNPRAAETYLQYSFRYNFYRPNDLKLPDGPFYQYRVSRVPLQVDQVVIKRSGEAQNHHIVAVRDGQWKTIELKPREILTLDWRLREVPGVARCEMPQPEAHVYHWSVYSRGFRGEGMNEQDRSVTYLQVWELVGTQIIGKFRPNLRLSDQSVHRVEEMTQKNTQEMSDYSLYSLDDAVGAVVPGAPVQGCQGVY